MQVNSEIHSTINIPNDIQEKIFNDPLIVRIGHCINKLLIDTKYIHQFKIAVACSGGPDSTLLAIAAHRWGMHFNKQVIILIVDHRLRSESSIEAKTTLARLKAMGCHATILSPSNPPSKSSQHSARHLRMTLINHWCAQHHVKTLMLAHHANDQIETFMLRLEKQSGAIGLAAMSTSKIFSTLTLIRPMLNITKQQILRYIKQYDLPVIDDPSNNNINFRRVYFRNLFKQKKDLTKIVLSTVQAMQINRRNIEFFLNKWCQSYAQWTIWGGAVLQYKALHALSLYHQKMIFNHILMHISARALPVSNSKNNQILQKLTNHNNKRISLANCLIEKKGEYLFIYHEMTKDSHITAIADKPILWQNRFKILVRNAPSQSYITLANNSTAAHLQRFLKTYSYLPKRQYLKHVPIEACANLPVLHLDATPIATPWEHTNLQIDRHVQPTIAIKFIPLLHGSYPLFG